MLSSMTLKRMDNVGVVVDDARCVKAGSRANGPSSGVATVAAACAAASATSRDRRGSESGTTGTGCQRHEITARRALHPDWPFFSLSGRIRGVRGTAQDSTLAQHRWPVEFDQ